MSFEKVQKLLHFDCFKLMYRIFKRNSDDFGNITFQMFRPFTKYYQGQQKHSLLKNILYTFRKEIIIGGLITLVFASINLVVPRLFTMFLQYLQGDDQGGQVKSTSQFLRTLLIFQFLQIIFGQHRKKIFYELAIKIQSSLSKQLVKKSLTLNQALKLSLSNQIMSLQYVDVKLIFQMFQSLYLVFQTPFTILVASLMLFNQNKIYGLIGIYWFIIGFLVHLQLNQKLIHCNHTKLQLIAKRCKTNFEIMENIVQAKIIGWQEILIEKNNDLFEHQNEDHVKFYRYISYYDIIILMLPVLVVISICVYDLKSEKPIKVQNVFMILTLLTITFRPMKSLREIFIRLHDGLRGLNNIQKYLYLPNQIRNDLTNSTIPVGTIIILENTLAQYKFDDNIYSIQTKCHIQVQTGEKLIVLGKKKQGQHLFVETIIGLLKVSKGKIALNGVISCNFSQEFFTHQKIIQNIKFFNQEISERQVVEMVKKIGLFEDLLHSQKNLESAIDDPNIYSQAQRSKILIARALCQKADIYIIQEPQQGLNAQALKAIEQILNQKLRQKKTVIYIPQKANKIQDKDKVIIIERAKILQFGYYQDMYKDQNSLIGNFISKENPQFTFSPQKTNKSLSKFKSVVKKISLFRSLSNIKDEQVVSHQIKKNLKQFLNIVLKKKDKSHQKKAKHSFFHYLKSYVFSVPYFSIFFILLIIGFAQFLHIFIHYFFGHLDENTTYVNYLNMVIFQMVLTAALALILYIEGEVSSLICVSQGNTLYSESLKCLTEQNTRFFVEEDRMAIAKIFNHDYQQIYIGSHLLLSIYKNIFIVMATLYMISNSSNYLMRKSVMVFLVYLGIYMICRSIKAKIIKYDTKYRFKIANVLEEGLRGGNFLYLYKKQNQYLKRMEHQYKRVGAYKIAMSYASHSVSIACDLTSMILLSALVIYGFQNMGKTKATVGFVATCIHLLLNSSSILKSIVIQIIKFQKFFSINIIPFIQMRDLKRTQNKQSKNSKIQTGEILFNKVEIIEDGIRSYEPHPLLLKIKEGEKVLLYEVNTRAKQALLMVLTGNLALNSKSGPLLIGGANIKDIDRECKCIIKKDLRRQVGVIMKNNFFLSGSLRRNIEWKYSIDDQEAKKYVEQLQLDLSVLDYKKKGLGGIISFQVDKIDHQITKKLALVRILLRKPKIVIIKDTSDFVSKMLMVDLILKYIPRCTIIKISNNLQTSSNVDRIIHMDRHVVLEEGAPQVLYKTLNSKLGQQLRDSNIEGYLYMNKASIVRPNIFLKQINQTQNDDV